MKLIHRFSPLQKKKETECRSQATKLQLIESAKVRLERELNSFMTRESKRVDAHDQEIQQASELNAKLQTQLQNKEEVLKKQEAKLCSEVGWRVKLLIILTCLNH